MKPARGTRTRVRRLPARGFYDRETIDRILDAGLVCHVGYLVDGQPYVTPTAYWRTGDWLYWHGSTASRMLRHLAAATPVCVTVTLLDGIVFARSAFHHSMNYRCVMAFGVAERVEGAAAKRVALERFMERLVPGRGSQVRGPSAKELRATTILGLKIDEASAKIRAGGPLEDESDYGLPCWGGVVPIVTGIGSPEPDEHVAAGAAPPANLSRLRMG